MDNAVIIILAVIFFILCVAVAFVIGMNIKQWIADYNAKKAQKNMQGGTLYDVSKKDDPNHIENIMTKGQLDRNELRLHLSKTQDALNSVNKKVEQNIQETRDHLASIENQLVGVKLQFDIIQSKMKN